MASRTSYLLLLSNDCSVPTLVPPFESPLLGLLQTLVDSELSETDHLSRWVWHAQDLHSCAKPLEVHRVHVAPGPLEPQAG